MIELSKNYVALNMTKFIYEEEAKAGKSHKQEEIKEYIFGLYEECLTVVEENDSSNFELDVYDIDEDEGKADGHTVLS